MHERADLARGVVVAPIDVSERYEQVEEDGLPPGEEDDGFDAEELVEGHHIQQRLLRDLLGRISYRAVECIKYSTLYAIICILISPIPGRRA